MIRMWIFTVAWCLLASTAQSASSDVDVRPAADLEVRQALYDLKKMCWHNQKPRAEFDADLERHVAEMLKKFPDPWAQGQFWFELTEFYASSGGPWQRMLECAKKTLEFPITPVQRIRSIESWSSAYFAVNGDLLLHPEGRKEAAAIALDGYVEFRKIDLANYVPTMYIDQLPQPPPSIPKEDKAFWERERREAVEKEKARVVKEITLYGNALINSLVDLYRLRPYAAPNELRDLIMEKTHDSKLADRLVKEVDVIVAADIAKYGPYVPPPKYEPIPLPARGKLLFTLTSLLVILVSIFIIRRRHRVDRGRAV